MTRITPRVVLLGPQAPLPTVGSVVKEIDPGGRVAVITAGWQEWESDLAGLRSQLGDVIVPLRLYQRAERIWEQDHELRVAHRRMQSDLKGIRRLYARQLDRAAEAWMELLETEGPERIVGPEREAALEAIQRLDAHHLRRIDSVQTEFRDRMTPLERRSVSRARGEILQDLSGCSTVVIEGGHAAVLHNRIVLFDLMDEIRTRIVVGCAAGAMILGGRVVLYNDQPAIGRGNAEVGLPGHGLVPGVVALPDAAFRLRLDDRSRMRRLALRLSPDRCALLDPGHRLDWDGRAFTADGSRLVRRDGTLVPWDRAA